MDSDSEMEHAFAEDEDLVIELLLKESINQRVPRVSVTNYIGLVDKMSDTQFLWRFGVTKNVSEYLTRTFENSDCFRQLNTRISSKKHILLLLWYSRFKNVDFKRLSDRFDVSVGSVHNIIKRVSEFFSNIAEAEIQFPSSARKTVISEYFHNKYGVPRVIGNN